MDSQITSHIDFGALDFFRQSSKENEVGTEKKRTRKRKTENDDLKKTESTILEETESLSKKKKKKKKKSELEGLFINFV